MSSLYQSGVKHDHDAEDDIHQPAKRARFTARIEDTTDAFRVTQVDGTDVLVVDTATPSVNVTGSLDVTGSLTVEDTSDQLTIQYDDDHKLTYNVTTNGATINHEEPGNSLLTWNATTTDAGTSRAFVNLNAGEYPQYSNVSVISPSSSVIGIFTSKIYDWAGALKCSLAFGSTSEALIINAPSSSTHIFTSSFDVIEHDGVTTGLKLGGTLVTATADELNYVDGVTSNVQTQLDTRLLNTTDTFTGTLTVDKGGDTSTVIRVVTSALGTDGLFIKDSSEQLYVGLYNAFGVATALLLKQQDGSEGTVLYGEGGGTSQVIGDFDIFQHNGVNKGLKLGGTYVTVTATDLNYLDGVTANVQTQLDDRLLNTTDTFAGLLTINSPDSYSGVDVISKTGGTDGFYIVEDGGSDVYGGLYNVFGSSSVMQLNKTTGTTGTILYGESTSTNIIAGDLNLGGVLTIDSATALGSGNDIITNRISVQGSVGDVLMNLGNVSTDYMSMSWETPSNTDLESGEGLFFKKKGDTTNEPSGVVVAQAAAGREVFLGCHNSAHFKRAKMSITSSNNGEIKLWSSGGTENVFLDGAAGRSFIGGDLLVNTTSNLNGGFAMEVNGPTYGLYVVGETRITADLVVGATTASTAFRAEVESGSDTGDALYVRGESTFTGAVTVDNTVTVSDNATAINYNEVVLVCEDEQNNGSSGYFSFQRSVGTGSVGLKFGRVGGTARQWYIYTPGGSTDCTWYTAPNRTNTTGGATCLHMSASSGTGAITSDRRAKSNIRALDANACKCLNELKPSMFSYKNGDGRDCAGFIAQEVMKTSLKRLVRVVQEEEGMRTDFKDEDNPGDLHTFNQGELVPYLVKAIQELMTEVDGLKLRLSVLEM